MVSISIWSKAMHADLIKSLNDQNNVPGNGYRVAA